MIQLTRPKSGAAQSLTIVRVNLKDELTSDFDTSNGLLVYLRSQLTSKLITTTPIANWGAGFYNARFATFFLYVSPDGSNWNLGIIQMGTTEYPLGFYDINIYQNSSPTNFDSAGLNLLYTGLANVTASDAASSPTYTEYTTNDSDTERVYLTLE